MSDTPKVIAAHDTMTYTVVETDEKDRFYYRFSPTSWAVCILPEGGKPVSIEDPSELEESFQKLLYS